MHFSGCTHAVYIHRFIPQATCQHFNCSTICNGQNMHMAKHQRTRKNKLWPTNTMQHCTAGEWETTSAHKARRGQTQKEWKKPDHIGGGETNLWHQYATQCHPWKGGHWIKLWGIFSGLETLFLFLIWVLVTHFAYFAPNTCNLFTLFYGYFTSIKI